MLRRVVMPLTVAALAAGCCSKPKGSSSSSPPATTTVAVPAKRQILMRHGSDAMPEKWTTAERSKQLGPAYAASNGFAPQLSESDKIDVFESLAPDPDAGASATAFTGVGLAVCLVAFAGGADTGLLKGIFNCVGAELDVEVTPGKMPRLWEHGPEDRNWTYVSVPLVDGSAREPWTLHVLDRDEGASDDLGKLRMPTGFPRKVKQRDLTVTCRALPMEEVEARFAEALHQVDIAITKVADGLAVVPTEATLGMAPLIATLRRSIERLAAWVGWADPRVVRRREWGLRILQTLHKERAAFVRSSARTASKHASFDYGRGAYQVALLDFRCDASEVRKYTARLDPAKTPALGCILRLSATNVGDDDLSLDLGGALGWRAIVARADGETFPSTFLALEGPGVTRSDAADVPILAPGARGSVVLGLPQEVDIAGDPSKRAALVVMNPFMHSGAVLLSLGVTVPRPEDPVGDSDALN